LNAFRLFVALPLPEAVRRSILAAQGELRAAVPEGSVRWTKPDQLHVTLRFLGDVDAERVDELIASVQGACGHGGTIELQAGGLGVFPNRHRPRVLWTGIADRSGRLAALQRAVEAASAAFTTEKPEPAFTAHVTLGRCKTLNRKEIARLRTLMDEKPRSFGRWTADSVQIFRSELGPGGSRHSLLAAVPL
jgi:RNA 2',3'-cyclic 3'-phosphodiesterase